MKLNYAAVVVIKNGVRGTYNVAATRQPNTGNCSGTTVDNDLKLDSIVSPVNGRLLTSSALKANEKIKVRIRNLGNHTFTDSFSLRLNINDSINISSGVITADIPVSQGYIFEFEE
jgi:hypothetical protein